ncbi:hypothetical protein HS048_03775 [Planomonospora sp. ID91781]|uniref:hypothetical protein n=1 Tax=Planomonospora sp. ID91781 TaxID=2738135 RepID=UPI0018C35F03|nr:hypothetical protein [Planomonospora sp. ID91781]MBG0819865.1 hypothetical protein [Planomonospora sp. ID91781]
MAPRAHTLPAPSPEVSSWEQVAAREVSKAVLYLPPWIIVILAFGLGTAFHVLLDSDDPQTIAWTVVGITACVMCLTGLTWWQSHARSTGGRLHSTLTTFAAGMWVCAATINGPTTTVTGRLIVIGGVTLAASFNIRTVIRQKNIDVSGAMADPLRFLFGQGAERAGLPAVQARTLAATAHKVEGAVQLEPGRQTADDLTKKVPYIESGIGLPPGSVVTSLDPDDASKAKVTISDPRTMKNPIPWPGASRPGASIAEALRPGLWQDLDEVAHVIVGHHVQFMGMTGAGKSIGGAWNYLAEIVSRHDVAVFAIDITKGEQTLGPLKAALHRLETTKAGAKALLGEIQSKVKERTDQLSAKGLQKWKAGCGLTYWVLWIEEFPDVYDALTDKEQEQFLSLLKAIRSAGGTVVMSLQRSDYTQMPTLARGQLAKMCFGVESGTDASFGLSEAQQDAGARPELWSNKQPGMAYLDAPSIPDARIAMPLRTYAWGISGGVFDDERANAQMRAHAAAYPAAYKPVDAGTAAISRLDASALAAPVAVPERPDADPDEESAMDDEDVRGVVAEYLTDDDPDPAIQVGLDDEIPDIAEGEPPMRFAPADRKMTAEERGAALMERLHELWDDGARDFSSGDLKPLWTSTDISRAWVQKQLKRLVEAGILGGYDDEAQRYLMAERPEV